MQGNAYRYLTRSAGLRKNTFELLIVVAIERHARAQTCWHFKWIDAIPHHTIGSKTFELAVLIQKAQAVAISKTSGTGYIKAIVTNFFNLTYELTHSLWGIKRGNIWLTAIHKVSGVAAIKRTIEIGRKCIFATPFRRTTILIGMLTDISIKSFAIGSGNILNVTHILQTPLDFKRYGTCFNEFIQIIALVHILKREQVTLMFYLYPIGIYQ